MPRNDGLVCCLPVEWREGRWSGMTSQLILRPRPCPGNAGKSSRLCEDLKTQEELIKQRGDYMKTSQGNWSAR